MPEINTDKVCYLIVKARELESEDEGVEPDASNATDDRFVSALTEENYSPVHHEIASFIHSMDEDEQAELVAILFVGRGDFSAEEWDAAVALARERRKDGPVARYLLGHPLLASYLEDGLDALGESCEGFADDRQ